ncbi:hypothetical protein DWB85_16855 [Seongchinamella sediminis]|uniref:Uncharacterized protein n=1 Tax=Seongchinamella sediminis TaxID=2283635 RepID=A0A3L7DWG2_9GAMM|nr:hypothetical protein [Seongchinamella sediminis]RLQ20573.1 hypothetical protein DWB85_16855 [Seongchinamella sediminis]
MNKCNLLVVPVLATLCQSNALAFRNCEQQDDAAAYRGSSGYSVSEIEFDPLTRVATGTETHYNYANGASGHIIECHVTYELRGVYDASSALFLLSATRSNQSQSCEPDFITYNFPLHRSYTVQVDALADGEASVRHADNGDRFASADWQRRHMSYSTEESCELM